MLGSDSDCDDAALGRRRVGGGRRGDSGAGPQSAWRRAARHARAEGSPAGYSSDELMDEDLPGLGGAPVMAQQGFGSEVDMQLLGGAAGGSSDEGGALSDLRQRLSSASLG